MSSVSSAARSCCVVGGRGGAREDRGEHRRTARAGGLDVLGLVDVLGLEQLLIFLDQRREVGLHRRQHLRGQDPRPRDRSSSSTLPRPESCRARRRWRTSRSRTASSTRRPCRRSCRRRRPRPRGDRHLRADDDDVEVRRDQRARDLARDRLAIELELRVGIERQQRDRRARSTGSARRGGRAPRKDDEHDGDEPAHAGDPTSAGSGTESGTGRAVGSGLGDRPGVATPRQIHTGSAPMRRDGIGKPITGPGR